MKILQECKPDDWKPTVQCHSCHSLLEVEKEDVKVHNNSQDKEVEDLRYFVSCPVCKEWVNLNHAPNYVKQHAKAKKSKAHANQD
jgi:hypothetical protein